MAIPNLRARCARDNVYELRAELEDALSACERLRAQAPFKKGLVRSRPGCDEQCSRCTVECAVAHSIAVEIQNEIARAGAILASDWIRPGVIVAGGFGHA